MKFLGFLFASKKDDSQDVLGVYPEYMQVKALPERRYLKTARFLAVLILINVAILTAIAGFFVYVADRVDTTIANRRVVNLYTIDPLRKVIIPAEYEEKTVAATELYTESLLRDYIINRHEIIWDNTAMQRRWDTGGPVAVLSHYKRVYSPFRVEADTMFSESRSYNFVRDVHLYELRRVSGSLWEGVFDTFDMPIPDSFNPLCDCSDNSLACLQCKIKNTSRHQRFRVILRVAPVGTKSIANPLGYQVLSYNVLYVPIKAEEKYWGVPSDLRPDL